MNYLSKTSLPTTCTYLQPVGAVPPLPLETGLRWTRQGILFVTIEDETGIANGILWPDRFEIYRRQVMSASMIAMRGRLQKEGEVIHIICDRIVDHDDTLRSIGRTAFAVASGGATVQPAAPARIRAINISARTDARVAAVRDGGRTRGDPANP